MYDVTKPTQNIVNGGDNFGFIIIPDLAEGNTGREYVSTENNGPDTLNPKLILTFGSTSIKNASKLGYAQPCKSFCLNGNICVQFTTSNHSFEYVLIYSLDGTLITRHTIQEKVNSVKIPFASQGIFLLRVKAQEKSFTAKIFTIK